MLDSRTVITARPDQISSTLDEETIVLQLKSGTYYGLNKIGTRIWNYIQSPKSVGEVRETLLSEYEIEIEKCDQELQNLLEQLYSEGLIQIHPSSE